MAKVFNAAPTAQQYQLKLEQIGDAVDLKLVDPTTGALVMNVATIGSNGMYLWSTQVSPNSSNRIPYAVDGLGKILITNTIPQN